MPSVGEAISLYHDLLSKSYLDSTASALQASSARLSVGGRPVCTVLRPFFLSEDQYIHVRDASNRILRAIHTLAAHLQSDKKLRKQLDLSAEEEEIVSIDCGYGFPDVSGRLDGFLSTDGRFHFVEYNADSPGGIGYGDELADLFAGMPILQQFGKRYPFATVPVRSLTAVSLVAAYQRWGGEGLPNIGIVDWQGAPTFNEFVIFQEYLEKNGCRVGIVSPDYLEIRNNKLYAGDFRIDLLYKRVIIGELLARLGLNNVLVEAARRRITCVINGFAVQMLFKKSLFAMLSDPIHSNLFDEELLAAIRTHVPWTRKIRETETEHAGKTVDLLPFVSKNKDRFVLKPNGEYGGKGVTLGWEVTEAEWDNALQRALADSHVVQERVEIGRQLFPALVNGQLQFDERYFDLDPYVWNGAEAEGCGVRLSELALMNVSAGGGSAVPLFII